jgi:hypothetical protein
MRLVRRMGTPDPEPTEVQFFGASGILLALGAAAGILYALVQFLKWAISH